MLVLLTGQPRWGRDRQKNGEQTDNKAIKRGGERLMKGKFFPFLFYLFHRGRDLHLFFLVARQMTAEQMYSGASTMWITHPSDRRQARRTVPRR